MPVGCRYSEEGGRKRFRRYVFVYFLKKIIVKRTQLTLRIVTNLVRRVRML